MADRTSQTKDSLPGKRPEIKDQTKQPWVKLSGEDMARLNNKRAELSVVLRQWHRYSRMQADRVISNWLYNHGQARPDRRWQILPKCNPRPLTRLDA
jgi:hypothetical protein